MKKYFISLILLLVFFSFVNLNAQVNQNWKWSHPTPQGNTLRWVKIWNANTWYAAGFAGTFMKTTNAGATWFINHKAGRIAATQQYSNIYDAHFFDQNTGIVVGSTGIQRTTNGGVSFDTIPGLPTGATWYQIFFINNNTGYIAGTTSGRIAKTTNGGLNWTLNTLIPSGTYYDVYTANDTTILVASTSGNIQRSTDGGTTWTAVSTGASATLYKIEFLNPNTGWVTGTTGTARYTTNGGLNWTVAATGLPTGDTYYDLDVKSMTISNSIFEGFEDATFPPTGWKSVNVLGTNVWNRSTSQFYAGVASAFISYEGTGGEDWLITPKWGIQSGDSLVFYVRRNLSSAYPPDSLIVKVSTTDTALANFTNTLIKIDVANLANATWIRFAVSLNTFATQNIHIGFQHKDTDGNGMYLDNVSIPRGSAVTPVVYLTGNSYNIYRTTNMGTSWDTLGILQSTQPWTSTYYAADITSGDSIFAVGAYGLINRRVNAGNRTCYTSFLKAGTFYDVAANGNNGVVLAVGSPGTTGVYDQLFGSTNGGQTWGVVPFSTTSTATFRSVDFAGSNTAYVAGSNSALYRTTNMGVNWDSVPIPVIPAQTFYSVDFVNANTGFVFNNTADTAGTIWKTTNAGLNWTQYKLEGQTGSNIRIYGASMVDANTGWVVNYQPRPFKTTNGGVNWTMDSIAGTFSGYMYDIQMLNATTGYICGSSGKLLKTTNGGTLWDTVTTPYNTTYYSVSFKDANNGVIVGSSGIAARTRTGGTTWEFQNTSGSTLYSVFMTGVDTGFTVGSLSYIFKYNGFMVGNSTYIPLIPGNYELSQNYPNPFNPTTTISFAIPKAGNVSLKIFDITGREVASIFNNVPFNAGTIKHTFDGSSLASGVYFYSLIVDNNLIASKKMVLLK